MLKLGIPVNQTTVYVLILMVLICNVKQTLNGVPNRKNVLKIVKRLVMVELQALPQVLLKLLQHSLLEPLKIQQWKLQPLKFQAQLLQDQAQPLKDQAQPLKDQAQPPKIQAQHH